MWVKGHIGFDGLLFGGGYGFYRRASLIVFIPGVL